MASLKQNVASQNITFVLVNATTGAADPTGTGLAGFVTKDNGAKAGTAGTFTNKTNGQYNYAPTQAETNAVDVGFLFTATGDIPLNIDFHTDNVDAQGLLKVDLEDVGGAVLSTHAAGMVPADVRDIVGVAVSTTTAQLGVNVVQINAVATTPVTTVNAVQGTTANPLFTGQLIQSDTRDWLGTVVATPATLGIPDINVKNIANAAVSTTTAQIGSNVVQINGVPTSPITTITANLGTTQPVNFTGTAGAALVKTDVTDWATTAVPAPATTGIPDVNAKNIANTTAAYPVASNVTQVNGSTLSAQALAQANIGVAWGTCSGGSTTTAIVSALNNPTSLTDSAQLVNR